MMKLTQLPEQAQAKDVPTLAGQRGLFLRWKQNPIKDEAGKPTGKVTPVRKMYCHVPEVATADMIAAINGDEKLQGVVSSWLSQQWIDFARVSIEAQADDTSWEQALSSEYAFGFQSFIDWITTPAEASTGNRTGGMFTSPVIGAWFDEVISLPLSLKLCENWKVELDTLTDEQGQKLLKTCETYKAALTSVVCQRKHKTDGWKKVPTVKEQEQLTKLLALDGVADDVMTAQVIARIKTIVDDNAAMLDGLDDAL